jgi:hypothetical protein
VDSVADLELGLAEELVVGLGGEQLGDPPEFVLGGLTEGVEDPPGLVVLFRGKVIELRE